MYILNSHIAILFFVLSRPSTPQAEGGVGAPEPEVVMGTFRTNFATGEVEFSDPSLFRNPVAKQQH